MTGRLNAHFKRAPPSTAVETSGCDGTPASRWSALRQRRGANSKTKTFYEKKTKDKTVPV